jgi:hypothetical protein
MSFGRSITESKVSVTLEKKHIKSKKVIGKAEGQEVHLVTTFGGLQIIMIMKNNKAEILGAGAHVAHAKFEAEKKLKENIVWVDE